MEQFIEDFKPLISHIVTKYFYNKDDQEEALQEIWLAFWLESNKYDPNKSSPKSYVAIVTKRVCIAIIRSRVGKASAHCHNERQKIFNAETINHNHYNVEQKRHMRQTNISQLLEISEILLSKRDFTYLYLWAKGLTGPQICISLNIKSATARCYQVRQNLAKGIRNVNRNRKLRILAE